MSTFHQQTISKIKMCILTFFTEQVTFVVEPETTLLFASSKKLHNVTHYIVLWVNRFASTLKLTPSYNYVASKVSLFNCNDANIALRKH